MSFALVLLAFNLTVHYDSIQIPVRDGKWLAADVYLNDTMIAKPAILIQTPYNKNRYRSAVGVESLFPYDSAHYNYVILDWRGFYGSESAAVPGYDRGLDGYDAVEWISQRPWCNGKVGTWGPSALALIQFLTAKHRPPHLICSVPLVRDFKVKYSDFYYGGDYRKEHVENMERLGFVTEESITAHPSYDVFWQVLEVTNDYPESLAVPMLLISGWYDHYPPDVIRAFYDLRSRSEVSVRSKHKLIIGPWLHSGIGELNQGVLQYPNAVGISDPVSQCFFDFYIRNIQNGYEQEPVIRYYLMGTNEWRITSDWYSESNAVDTLYLRGGGLLSSNSATDSASYDSLMYDPRNPSPTVGGSRFTPFEPQTPVGPQDQRDSVESRGDVLVYTTPVLTSDLVVAGSVKILLYVSSNRKDTDFSVRLCDVYPDGRSLIVTQGIRRMRFRNSYSAESLMVPGEIYVDTVILSNFALTFLPGHRLRVDVSSSDYPMFDINLNNGDSLYRPGDTLVATNYVYHNVAYSSKILLPSIKVGIEENLNVKAQSSKLNIGQNPFCKSTVISYEISERSEVSLRVYDITGREIKRLVDNMQEAGHYSINLDMEGYSEGLYFIKLIAEKLSRVKKVIVF